MEKSDAVTRNISEQRIAAKVSVFIVISGSAPMREITAGRSSPLREIPVVRTHRCEMDRRETRSLKTSTNFTHFAGCHSPNGSLSHQKPYARSKEMEDQLQNV